MRRRSASAKSLLSTSLLPRPIVGLYSIALIKYNKLASFKRNKKLRSVRWLKRLIRRFSGNYKRKRRGVY